MTLPDAARTITQLVDAFYEPLYRYAYRLSGSAADAEDLTQDTFCKAQLQLAQLRDATRAKSWLFSILRNNYLHKARAERRHREVPLDETGDLAKPGSGEESEVDGEKLQQVLATLDEGFRTPIILYYFEDFSYREIAEHMDLPVGTVMSRLARAKAFLHARLSPSANGEAGGGGE